MSNRVLVRPEFVEAMHREILANERKGKWERFLPTRAILMVQLAYHQSKLMWAMESGSAKRVTEYSADVACLAMKAHELYGLRAEAADNKTGGSEQ